uniref:Propionate--CoA ligase n=1 Tax=Pogona vitticeps TaxID=103695 RepID=A0ABM5FFQ9_9SAUR
MPTATVAAAAAVSNHLLGSLRRQPKRLWSRSWPRLDWGRPWSVRLSSSSGGSCPPAGAPSSLRGDYRELCERAVREPGPFWGALARAELLWDTPHHTDCEWDFAQGRVRWFLGGRLNVAVNCLDRHVKQSPDKVALIWEKDEPGTEEKVTYRELLDMTCRLANTLKKNGIKKGDRVAIYMPVSPLAVAAMLACARIGAVHTVVFAGFSAESLAGRINDSECKAVITYNEGLRGGRIIEMKKTVDEAVKNCPSVKCVFVGQRTASKIHMSRHDILLEEAMAKEASVCTPETMDTEDMLFMLYTSGSTGKPKGIVHTQAGYLLYAALTHKHVFDVKQDDIFGCVADIGWITGHSYVVYGPLCNGTTTVLFESTPVYPDPETGGICIAPRPSEKEAEIIPAIAMRPFYGINPVLVDEKGIILEGNNVSGALCIAQPWPGMARTIYGDHQRFVEAYFKAYPGYYFTGDAAYRTKEGYYQITGRMDDVLNISGHRLGTAEIEDAMDEHPAVPEAAVISFPHDIKGEVPFAFVVLKDEKAHPEIVAKELREIVASKIAKYAVPDHVLVVKRLPKTRSGKIMRRLLRRIVTNEVGDMGDTTTLDDPSVIEEILDAYKIYKTKHPNL